MNGYQSIATINAPEFINLQPLDINPMMSKCEIKVLYLGKNRNGTSINKDAATEMAKTLRGAPIVGYYRDDKQDFFDHGDQVILDGEGIHFKTLTKPYGFVSPDADVWFQEFEEFDEAGESTIRTYLMTTGYLWTGQYQEAQQLFMEGGKPQSMELDENSMSGFWAKEANSDMEFFIINDAVFSKLCILGDDVEPCFEGSSITAPNVSKNFTLDDQFKTTLWSMMKELQYTLQGGSQKVEDEIKKKSVDSSIEVEEPQEPEVETPIVENPTNTGNTVEESTETTTEQSTETTTETTEETTTPADGVDNGEAGATEGGSDAGNGGDNGSPDYVKKDDSEDKEENDAKDEEKKDDEEDKEKEDDKYSLVVVELEELQKSYSALKEERDALAEKVASYENAEKDALIAEFSMLSDEDKQEVIEHKAEYSLDEIKSKLAVICYDKKINYTSEKEEKVQTVSIEAISYANDKPEWLQAVDKHKNS